MTIIHDYVNKKEVTAIINLRFPDVPPIIENNPLENTINAKTAY